MTHWNKWNTAFNTTFAFILDFCKLQKLAETKATSKGFQNKKATAKTFLKRFASAKKGSNFNGKKKHNNPESKGNWDVYFCIQIYLRCFIHFVSQNILIALKRTMSAPKSLLKYDDPVVVSGNTTEKSQKVRVIYIYL